MTEKVNREGKVSRHERKSKLTIIGTEYGFYSMDGKHVIFSFYLRETPQLNMGTL
jgi:hypothetical protein